MEGFLRAAQEKTQILLGNFQTSSNVMGDYMRSWKMQLTEKLSANQFQWETGHLRIRITETAQHYAQIVRTSWIAIQCNRAWNRCLYFLLVEVTRAHIFVGLSCFVFGGLTGALLNSRKPKSCMATPYMRAVTIENSEVAIRDDYEVPKIIKPTQVLVQVKASSIDGIDVANGLRSSDMSTSIHYSNRPKKDGTILGSNCSGIVAAVGKKVSSFERGDEVWLNLLEGASGTHAEYVVAEEKCIAPKPFTIDHLGAAALCAPLHNVWKSLVVRANLDEINTAGLRVLVIHGTGPETLFAIQLISAWGGHVTTTVPTQGVNFVESLGAHDVISENIGDELLSRIKFDIVYAPYGSNSCEKDFNDLVIDGGMVIVGLHNNPPGVLAGKSTYASIKQFLFPQHPGVYNRVEDFPNFPLVEALPFLNSGQVKVFIDKIFSMEEAESAYKYCSENPSAHKVVLKFSDRIRYIGNYS